MNGTLLKDLISYKIHKDKGVSMAAKSLLTLFRVINPSILPKKWLGKETDAKSKPKAYGAVEIRDHIEGTELLEQYDSLMSDEGMSFARVDCRHIASSLL
jgi:protein SDA1